MSVGKSGKERNYGHLEYPRCEHEDCYLAGEYQIGGTPLCSDHFTERLVAEPVLIIEALMGVLDHLESHNL